MELQPFFIPLLLHLHSGIEGLPDFIYSFGFLPHRQQSPSPDITEALRNEDCVKPLLDKN